jgi:uncharacterized protein (TIGR00730 family)
MTDPKTLCVYCSASNEVSPAYLEAARELGGLAARSGLRLVFGAGSVGLMGALADGALAEGGQVVGVIPEHLEQRELGHRGISEYIVVGSMHDRKRVMFDHADAFAILPGGLGTLDEAFEVITWRQLGLHDKPIFLVNLSGFWDPLLVLIEHLLHERFLHQDPARLFQAVDDTPALVEAVLAAPRPGPSVDSAML